MSVSKTQLYSTETFSLIYDARAFVPLSRVLEVRVRIQSQKTTGVDIIPF